MLKKISVDKSLRDQFDYPDNTFPVLQGEDHYNRYVDYTMNCHWHPDFEYLYVLSGEIDYYVNDTYIKLKKGDCFFINSNMLHMGRQPDHCNDAIASFLIFHPSLLAPNIGSTVYQRYLEPLMNQQIEGFVIPSGELLGREVAALLSQLHSLDAAAFGYELRGIELISRLLLATIEHIENGNDVLLSGSGDAQRAERAKEIISYIHEHYSEKITVEAIARHTGISRAECFRCFKRFMNKKPVQYINEYRLSKAASLLRETGRSVTEIYSECGFENASYFTKVFKETYGEAPLQYRKSK